MRPITTCCLLAALYAACTARAEVGNAPAGEATSLSRSPSASQLWLVSTRSLPHGAIHSSRRLLPEINRYETGWRMALYDELAGSDGPSLTTVVFVHGNDTDDAKCRAHGLSLYQALAADAPQPLRLIVWSWPADYIPGTLRQDARRKAERAEADSIYLSRFLADLGCGRQAVLVGYSLGARVAGGALHLLAGGTLDGQSVDVGAGHEQPPLRGVLIAAAIDDDWLLPGRRYERALAAVERMVLLVNPHDRVLRWYRLLTPGDGAAALGVHGIASAGALGAQRRKLEQIDVGPILGAQHGWSNYAASAPIMERLRHEVFANQGRRAASVQ